MPSAQSSGPWRAVSGGDDPKPSEPIRRDGIYSRDGSFSLTENTLGCALLG
jgi:hypothetical protein